MAQSDGVYTHVLTDDELQLSFFNFTEENERLASFKSITALVKMIQEKQARVNRYISINISISIPMRN